MSKPVCKVWIQVLHYADGNDENPTEKTEEFFGAFDSKEKAAAVVEFLTRANTLQQALEYVEKTT